MAGVYGYNPYQFYPQGQQMQYQSPQTYIGSQIPQQPQQPSMQTQQNGYTCRPVTSREEAVAVQTDYSNPHVLLYFSIVFSVCCEICCEVCSFNPSIYELNFSSPLSAAFSNT